MAKNVDWYLSGGEHNFSYCLKIKPIFQNCFDGHNEQYIPITHFRSYTLTSTKLRRVINVRALRIFCMVSLILHYNTHYDNEVWFKLGNDIYWKCQLMLHYSFPKLTWIYYANCVQKMIALMACMVWHAIMQWYSLFWISYIVSHYAWQHPTCRHDYSLFGKSDAQQQHYRHCR